MEAGVPLDKAKQIDLVLTNSEADSKSQKQKTLELVSDHDAIWATIKLRQIHKLRTWNSTFAWTSKSADVFHEC